MQKNIGKYLDEGSLRLFAQQLMEIVPGASAVGLHDNRGRLVWVAPQAGDKRIRQSLPGRLRLEKLRDPDGYREKLGKGQELYVFLLEDRGSLSGALSVLGTTGSAASWSHVLAEVKPILACLQRQLAINVELSSVRRLSARDREDLQLVLRLEEIETTAGVKPAIRTVLELCRKYFDCEMTAAVFPQLGVQEVCGAVSLRDPAARRPLLVAMGNLLASAKVHRKVLLANGLTGGSTAPSGPFAEGRKVLCCPVANARDEIVGIFVLLNDREFARRHIRLARAICTKLAVLAKTAVDTVGEKLSRHGLIHHVDSTIKRHPNSTHALLYFDVDKLHVVNDSFGHRAGDGAIAKVAELLDEHAGADEVVAHLSGDRFAFFMRDCKEERATSKAEAILGAMRQEAIEHEGKAIELSASVGIAIIPTVAENGSEALSIAEIACRGAKDRGGNRLVVFRDLDASMVQRRMDLEQVGYLQTSLLQNRFVLYAQPIKPLQDDKAVHRYEILIRLQDADGRIVSPSKVLPAAERYKMMATLDRWVIRRALEQLGSATNTLEISLATFCINISGQSLADDSFASFVEARIQESGISPDSLCFEITETAIVRNLERAQRFIVHLRKLGCRFALDDFGTGYSSFAYLKSLPVQYLKVDGVFIRDLLENRLSEAIVSASGAIAKVMGAATVAEHVENELVMQKVRDLGIDYAQGFLISRPRPLSEILEDIDNQNNLDLPTLLAAGS